MRPSSMAMRLVGFVLDEPGIGADEPVGFFSRVFRWCMSSRFRRRGGGDSEGGV